MQESARLEIKRASNRLANVLESKPALGQQPKSVECRVSDTLRADCTAGEFELTVALKRTLGGDESGPSPGALVRAGVASCLGLTYAIYFARRDVIVEDIRVGVESVGDSRAFLGVAPVTPGFHGLRYHVEIVSDADPDLIREIVDESDANCAMLQSIVRPVPAERELEIVASAQATE